MRTLIDLKYEEQQNDDKIEQLKARNNAIIDERWEIYQKQAEAVINDKKKIFVLRGKHNHIRDVAFSQVSLEKIYRHDPVYKCYEETAATQEHLGALIQYFCNQDN